MVPAVFRKSEHPPYSELYEQGLTHRDSRLCYRLQRVIEFFKKVTRLPHGTLEEIYIRNLANPLIYELPRICQHSIMGRGHKTRRLV
ncbi:hypothetical protein KIN20_034405 [Parelaphostrongylus tenuis]|uniref:Uncharacterized protein n=1 Tax=Parelaphostrongylus tenuis TaxID=148309 RepID=A0AAD5RAA6_PARTN|nr:hypothetical protein KIN20_034405 [Parelaphostrongylus tenuis]